MPKQTRSPEDQRADVKNPNNEDFKTDQDHRSQQLNPQDPLYTHAPGREASGGSSDQNQKK
ncbi:hypothetical protein [Hyalangium rubrum]|uniref:Uncharacterized protein n=1 Tax=Hyalangium rubrum TaxID=3103134 RepID=A0ABU5HA06_9BACT|nr:hypothetical protein [Hyalangium sp. s54d21]MDY7230316.1 hypothetical protein [Hyalangium sp. s54d21]